MKHPTPFLALLVFLSSAVFADQPDACSLTSTVTDAKLTLTIRDGRTSFREGEIIPLVLSFTFTDDKRYRAHAGGLRMEAEAYCLKPEARDPLADDFQVYMAGRGPRPAGETS